MLKLFTELLIMLERNV